MRTFFILFLSYVCLCFQNKAYTQEINLQHRFDSLMYNNKVAKSLKVKGHSHNDYKQNIPFYTAYHAGMESIEIDLFLRNDSLYAAHEVESIAEGKTFEKLYLQPLLTQFKANNKHAFKDSTKSLQLLIDLKEDYKILMPALVKLLNQYSPMFADTYPNHSIRVVISGNIPPTTAFDDYPEWIYFDGRPNIIYTDKQRKRLGMISDDLRNYTNWNGKGVPTASEMQEIMKVSSRAHEWGIPFRLWGTPESVNTWLVLEKMGITWLNTDQPAKLQMYLTDLPNSKYSNLPAYKVYQPTYKSDGKDTNIKNVILLIGDGMGMAHIQSAIIANKGESNMAKFRHIGFSNTSSLSPGNTDSGAGGSAIATGQKTVNGALSVDSSGRPLLKIPELLRPKGIHSAIISTGDASDATPAAFYTSHPNRNASEEISNSLATNTSIDILIGTKPGVFQQQDKLREFHQKLSLNNFELVQAMNEFTNSTKDKIIFYAADSVMRPVKDGRPAILKSLLQESIDKLKSRGNGFFIMAEAAQIDYAGHARDLGYVITETADFDIAVGEALRFADTNPETLVIVVADHETGGLTILDADEKTGSVQANFASNDHSSMYIPVLAYGPQSYLFGGFYSNTEIFEKIMSVFNSIQSR